MNKLFLRNCVEQFLFLRNRLTSRSDARGDVQLPIAASDRQDLVRARDGGHLVDGLGVSLVDAVGGGAAAVGRQDAVRGPEQGRLPAADPERAEDAALRGPERGHQIPAD